MIKFIPNLLTISNLICGCIALFMCFNEQLVFAAYLSLSGGIFDFFDGASARWLNVSSEIGKQLDSMADLVSFGLVPGAIVFQLLQNSNINDLSFIALSIPIFSAYRLAKFNIDNSQSENFIGLPTPALSLFFCSFPLIIYFEPESFMAKLIQIPQVILVSCLIMSYALIMKTALFSLKFKNINYADNWFRINFIIVSTALLIFLNISAIPLIILVYIIGSRIYFKKNV